MVVPTPAKVPVKKPPARPAGKPMANLPAAPPAKPTSKPPAAPQAKRATAEPPAATQPNLPREPGMVAVPLPAMEQPKRAATAGEVAIVRHRITGFASSSWLRKLWPPAEKYLPADATIPGKAEQWIALQLAVVLSVAALASATPVVIEGHANLLTAPRWALTAVFVATLQLVYAVWMINAPDWVSARVQMVVCAVVTTVYGMVMTLTMITAANHPLILGLGEVRRFAPAWCGMMLVLMGAATWFCGRTSARWRRSLMLRSEE